MLKGHKEEQTKYGCSIIPDAWTDGNNRTLINYLVNSSIGSMFVKSVNASKYMKTREKIFKLPNSFVEKIDT